VKNYLVNEIYYTIQGEGIRYGIPHVFVRFAKCNLTCKFCDTEFESYTEMSAEQIVERATELVSALPPPTDAKIVGQRKGGTPLPHQPCRNVMFCGGEPLMQVDDELVAQFKGAGWFMALETNGTYVCPDGVDWVACSPKVAEHAIKLKRANELKYVRGDGQGIPHPKIPADFYLLSPMYDGNVLNPRVLEWVANLVKQYPMWRLTIQHHKANFGDMR
jgi:organic radical activating enzyme